MQPNTNTKINSEKKRKFLQLEIDPELHRDFKAWCSLNGVDMKSVVMPVIIDKANKIRESIQYK